MLNWAFEQLAVDFSGFNVFRYLTFRAICGVVTAMVICFVVGPRMIERLGRLQIGETIRPDGKIKLFICIPRHSKCSFEFRSRTGLTI